MDNEKLKFILKVEKDTDINEKVIELKKIDDVFSSGISTFVMLEDAKRESIGIYKIITPLKSNENVPRVIPIKNDRDSKP